jgi:hypothetical protein
MIEATYALAGIQPPPEAFGDAGTCGFTHRVKVQIVDVKVRGKVASEEELRRTLRIDRFGLGQCYDRVLLGDPSAAGTLKFEGTLDAYGNFDLAKVLRSDFADGDACAITVGSSRAYPRAIGAKAHVIVTVVFSVAR